LTTTLSLLSKHARRYSSFGHLITDWVEHTDDRLTQSHDFGQHGSAILQDNLVNPSTKTSSVPIDAIDYVESGRNAETLPGMRLETRKAYLVIQSVDYFRFTGHDMPAAFIIGNRNRPNAAPPPGRIVTHDPHVSDSRFASDAFGRSIVFNILAWT
jgi:hypothetical protein